MKKYTKGKNLAVFLAIGESLKDFEKKGQLKRLLGYNIKYYLKAFDKVFIFSYQNESTALPLNCVLVPNRYKLHRYLYALLMPLIEAKTLYSCTTVRALQITGGIPAFISSILYRKPYVVNYGYDYEYYAKLDHQYLLSFIFKFLKYPVLLFSTFVIVTSPDLKNRIKFLDIKKIRLIPNGVDLNLFKKRKTKDRSGTYRLTFIGRLELQKNLANLVRACAGLDFKYQLIFYGDGSQKNNLIKLAKRLNVNLEIRKPVNYSMVTSAINSADLFILPSLIEGNPKVLLEAMACESKVVVSDVPGNRELINDGKNGFVCQTDPESITRTIKRAISSEANLGKNARSFVETNFDIHTLLDTETSLLLSTLK